MRRDFDLIRQILLAVEQAEPFTDIRDLGPFEAEFETVAYHAQLLVEARLLKALISEASNSRYPIGVMVERLTWAGHDYLDTVRSETIWSKVKATLAERIGTAAFEVVKAVAIAIAKSQVGL
jgi:Hypothetical protein (DUF2513)